MFGVRVCFFCSFVSFSLFHFFVVSCLVLSCTNTLAANIRSNQTCKDIKTSETIQRFWMDVKAEHRKLNNQNAPFDTGFIFVYRFFVRIFVYIQKNRDEHRTYLSIDCSCCFSSSLRCVCWSAVTISFNRISTFFPYLLWACFPIRLIGRTLHAVYKRRFKKKKQQSDLNASHIQMKFYFLKILRIATKFCFVTIK